MFKISEFSKLVRVSARMLRYYDRCGLLHPAEIDKFTGYRLYSAAQLPIASRIAALRDMGFGIEEIEQILPHYDDPKIMASWLDGKSRQIGDAINAEHCRLEKIALMRDLLFKESNNMIYDVEVKALPEVKVLSLCQVIPSYDKEGMLWERLGGFMAENGVSGEAGGYSIYHDDEYKESDVRVEIAAPVRELGESRGDFVYKTLPAIPLAGTVRFSGPYEGYSKAMEKLASWLEESGYQFDGNVRGLAVASPSDTASPEDYMTELQVPVRKV